MAYSKVKFRNDGDNVYLNLDHFVWVTCQTCLAVWTSDMFSYVDFSIDYI
jgi:hypothetical protein